MIKLKIFINLLICFIYIHTNAQQNIADYKIFISNIEDNLNIFEQHEQIKILLELKTKPDNYLINIEDIENDRKKIEQYIKKRGYFKTNVKAICEIINTNKIIECNEIIFNLTTKENNINIYFKNTLNIPCQISSFFARQDKILAISSIKSGDICDLKKINISIKEHELNLKQNGYIDAKFLPFKHEELYNNLQSLYEANFSKKEQIFFNLKIDDSFENAILEYRLHLGKKTEIILINKETNTELNSSNDFINNKSVFSIEDLEYLSTDDLIQRISNYYKTQGYPDIQVTEIENNINKKNTESKIFEISFNNLYNLDYYNTTFIGDFPLNKQEVLEELEIRPTLIQILYQQYYPYNSLKHKTYADNLLLILRKKGYLLAQVKKPSPIKNNTNFTISLKFEVNAGPQFIIKNLILQGVPPNFNFENLKSYYFSSNKALNFLSLCELSNNILKELHNNAYIKAKIEQKHLICSTNNDDNLTFIQLNQNVSEQTNYHTDITLKIIPDGIFKIAKIQEKEIQFNKGKRVVLESSIKTGDLLNTNKIINARNRILSHGLYSNIRLEGIEYFDELSSSETKEIYNKDVFISSSKLKNWNLNLNPSWDLDNGYKFKTEYQRNNLTHDGLQFIIQSNIYEGNKQYSHSKNAKYILGFDLNTTLKEPLWRINNFVTPFDWNIISIAYSTDLENEPKQIINTYTDWTWKPELIMPKYSINFNNNLEFSLSKTNYFFKQNIEEVIKILERSDNVTLLKMQLKSQISRLNDLIQPSNGIITSLKYSFASVLLQNEQNENLTGIKTSFFNSLETNINLFTKINNNISFHTKYFMQYISNMNAPNANRIHHDQNSNIRGFLNEDSRNLGPFLWHTKNDYAEIIPIASTNSIVSKSEIIFKLTKYPNINLITFFDLGNDYLSTSDIDTLNSRLNNLNKINSQEKTNIIDNNKIRNLENASFFIDLWDNSYRSVGLGIKYIFHPFTIKAEWGFPIYDLNKNCPYFSDIKNNASTTSPPSCIRRMPNYIREYNNFSNIRSNIKEVFFHPTFSIEGYF